MTKLYCGQCKKHTEHSVYAQAYSDICNECHTHTSRFLRVQAEAIHITAPDGTEATTVLNTPNSVTFYVPTGAHKGYYEYDKRTGNKTIKGIV